MLLSLIVAGTLLLVSTKSEEHNKTYCDSAVYEDKLYKVIKLFNVLEKCSQAIPKDKVNGLEVSEKYRRLLDAVDSNEPQSHIPPKTFLGPISRIKSRDLEPNGRLLQFEVQNPEDESASGNLVLQKLIKRQIPGPSDFFGFKNPGFPAFPKDFFQPNSEGNFFPFSSQRKKPQSKTSPEDLSRPNNEVGSQDQFDLFFPSSQRRTPNQVPPKGIFGPSDQEGQKNKIFYFPRGLTRPSQIQERPNNSFRPISQKKPKKINGNQDNSVTAKDEKRIQPPQTTSSRLETTTLPGPPPWATAPSTCVKQCPHTPEFNPVCGTDRVTYKNPGRLSCEQQCGKEHVKVNYYGNCIATTPPPPRGKGAPGRTTTPPTFTWNLGR